MVVFTAPSNFATSISALAVNSHEFDVTHALGEVNGERLASEGVASEMEICLKDLAALYTFSIRHNNLTGPAALQARV